MRQPDQPPVPFGDKAVEPVGVVRHQPFEEGVIDLGRDRRLVELEIPRPESCPLLAVG